VLLTTESPESKGAQPAGSSILDDYPYKPPTGQLCRVFLSHAGEEKGGFVAFLHRAFKQQYPQLEVFLDELSLQGGGRAMPAIYDSLADAFVGERTRSCSLHSSCG
jgi:hypothetical protein